MEEMFAVFIALLLGWFEFLLFKFGFFLSFKKIGSVSYRGALSNGWLLGWLFSIPLFFVWSIFVVVMYIGLDYSGSAGVAFFVFCISIGLGLFMPGVSVAFRLFSDFPSLPRLPLVQVVLGWAIPVPLLAGIVFWYWRLFWMRSDLRMLFLEYELILVVLLVLVFVFIGWFVGREVMDLIAAGSAMQAREKQIYAVGGEVSSSFSEPIWARRIQGFFGWLGFDKVVFGWGIVWVAFVWLMVPQIHVRGWVPSFHVLFYMGRSVVLMAILVSAGAGGVATLLMRGDGVSWARSLEDARVWFLGGLLGWGVAVPIGYFCYYLYFRLYWTLIRVVEWPRFLRPFDDMSLWVAGFLGLVIAFRFVRGRFVGRV